MNCHARGAPLILLALSVLVSACGGRQTVRIIHTPADLLVAQGEVKPSSYFGKQPKAFWWYDQVGVGQVHALQKTGDGQTVAIVDTGVLKGHEDVNIIDPTGKDVCSPSIGDPDDVNGHGTALAGIAVGKDKGAGAATGGVAPKAKLLPVKVVCGVSSADSVMRGVNLAIAAEPAVILLALGAWPSNVVSGKNVHQLLQDPVSTHPEILFVVASVWDGKTTYTLPDGTSYTFPPWTGLHNVLLVAGTRLDGTDEVFFSDKGASIWAPAQDIETASIEDEPGMANKHAKFYMQGTSAAAAIVAGCAAAVKVTNVDTGETLKKRLIEKADKPVSLGGNLPRLNCLQAAK